MARQSGFDGVDQGNPCMIPGAHGFPAGGHHNGLGHLAKGIGCRIGTKTPVVFKFGDGRIGEKFEVVVWQAVLAVNDGRALGLNADANARACKLCSRETEERCIGGVPKAHNARLEPALFNGINHVFQHGRQAVASRSLKQVQAKGGADADDHFLQVSALPGRPQDMIVNAPGFVLLVKGFGAQHLLLVEHVANGIEFKTAAFGNTVTTARSL